MNDLRTAAQQALEALTPWADSDHTVQHAAYHSLRAALAQHQAEPYAGKAARLNNDRVQVDPVTGNVSIGAERAEPVSTAVAMRDARLNAGWGSPQEQAEPDDEVCDGTRGGLCIHQDPNECERERDCPAFSAPPKAEPVQEPVAWLTPGQDLHLNNPEGFRFSDWTPLYTAPPKLVPLTEDEIAEAMAGVLGLPHDIKVELARDVERALEEKNRGR